MPLSPYYHGPTPSDLGRGSWGSVAPYRCDTCGKAIWCEPWADCIARATALDPGEWAYRCPHCGRHEVREQEQGPRVCHVTNRTTIHAARHALAA